MDLLKLSDNNIIKFNNEIYYKNDDEHTEGVLVYTHTGFTETDGGPTLKYISITIATNGWVLTVQNISSGSGGGSKLYYKTVICPLYDDLNAFNIQFTCIVKDNTDTNANMDYCLKKYWHSAASDYYGCPLVTITQHKANLPTTGEPYIIQYIVYSNGSSYYVSIVYLKDGTYKYINQYLGITGTNSFVEII